MKGAWIAIATLSLVVLLVAPAAADARNHKPRIVSLKVVQDGPEVELKIVGRDRDDVVRGLSVSWGEDGPEQEISTCTVGKGDSRKPGKRERFRSFYTFPESGHHTVTVQVMSGGCGGKRPQQRSKRRTLTIHVG